MGVIGSQAAPVPAQGVKGSSWHTRPLFPQSKSTRSPQPPQNEATVPVQLGSFGAGHGAELQQARIPFDQRSMQVAPSVPQSNEAPFPSRLLPWHMAPSRQRLTSIQSPPKQACTAEQSAD